MNRPGAAILFVLAGAAIGCSGTGASPRPPRSFEVLVEEQFENPAEVAATWRTGFEPTQLPVVTTAVHNGDRALEIRLLASQSGRTTVRRTIDGRTVGGHRVRIRADVVATESAFVRVGLVARRPDGIASYEDAATSRKGSGDRAATLHAIIDVATDAGGLDIEIAAEGVGSVWIDDVVVEDLGVQEVDSAARELDSDELSRLATATRIIGLVRYFHPSDESVALDWDAFIPTVIERALAARSTSAFLEAMRSLFADIAPTADLYEEGNRRDPLDLPRGKGTFVTRWRHIGLGLEPDSAPYFSHREGYRPQPGTSLLVFSRFLVEKLGRCKAVEASVETVHVQGALEARLVIRGVRGARPDDLKAEPAAAIGTTSVVHPVPAGIGAIDVGLRFSGEGSVSLGTLQVSCDGKRVAVPTDSEWRIDGDGTSLYTYEIKACDQSVCIDAASMRPQTESDAANDVIDVPIGSGLRLRLPVGVWSDGLETFPQSTAPTAIPSYTIRDLPTRLGAVASTWVTLHHFYPYFDDVAVDWDHALDEGLQRAARADSSSELHATLSRMVAVLADNHARVAHPGAPTDGILPVSLRQLDGRLIVTGGLDRYVEQVGLGAEVLAIGGLDAADAIAESRARVSAATEGWADYGATYWVRVGRLGDLVTLKFRSRGEVRELVMPRISRSDFFVIGPEPRPTSGSEIAPGVVYVNVEGMDEAGWASILPNAEKARVLVFDNRGYLTTTAFDVIGHLVDHEVRSAQFEIPRVGPTSPAEFGYQQSQWGIVPVAPRLSARVIFLADGRAYSAVETLLQIVRENSIGTIVGEQTGGTNGNIDTFDVTGGFTIRFTGMRVPFADGTAIQGRGITPDIVVHPTLAGVVEGRDEVLEAAISLAKEWNAP